MCRAVVFFIGRTCSYSFSLFLVFFSPLPHACVLHYIYGLLPTCYKMWENHSERGEERRGKCRPQVASFLLLLRIFIFTIGNTYYILLTDNDKLFSRINFHCFMLGWRITCLAMIILLQGHMWIAMTSVLVL